MKKIILLLIIVAAIGCKNEPEVKQEITGEQSRSIAEMIEAVNEKNPDKYVADFADSVQVFVESEVKVKGKEALKANRENHFKSNPDVRSEIQHLVEINNRVILHDKVWLNETDKVGQDVVEIFTFNNGKVIRVDVIQPKNPFSKNR